MFAPLPAVSKRTRLAKMVSVLLAEGYELRFFGWERVRGELDRLRLRDTRVKEQVILRGGGYVSRRVRLMYPFWMLSVFWNVVRLRPGSVLFCLGWESAFPAVLATNFTDVRIIFDDADRFSLILRLPSALNRSLQSLERWTSRRAFMHLIPGRTRYEWLGSNMRVLRNTPTTTDLQNANAKAPPRPDADLVVYINGWVGDTRGAPIFLRAFREAIDAGCKLAVHFAGRVDSPDGEVLLSLPCVIDHGELSQETALALYPASDIVLTYYDPTVPINRKAESNKWGDCVYFRKPFIVNDEVETARTFVNKGCAMSLPYHDAAGLSRLLNWFAENRDKLHDMADAFSHIEEEYQPYDVQVAGLIRQALS